MFLRLFTAGNEAAAMVRSFPFRSFRFLFLLAFCVVMHSFFYKTLKTMQGCSEGIRGLVRMYCPEAPHWRQWGAHTEDTGIPCLAATPAQPPRAARVGGREKVSRLSRLAQKLM